MPVQGISFILCHHSNMEDLKNTEDFSRELLARYLGNEVNSREKAEVEHWLSQSGKNREELVRLKNMLSKVDAHFLSKRFDSGKAWEKVHSAIQQEQPKVVQLKKTRKEALLQFYKYAAIILIAFLLGSVGYYLGFRNHGFVVYSEIIAAENQVINEYVLPDGTKVALNGGSQLTFPKHFKGEIREVSISGEAFFDVVPNPEKPFVINAGDAQIKVLGTSFNVSAYPGNETVEVVVQTGKVQLTGKKEEGSTDNIREVLLVPGEKGTFYSRNRQVEKAINTNPNFLAWKTHDLIFEDVPLGEVIQCLEKIYHVNIGVSDPALNELLLNAHFENKTIDFVLDVVRLTFNLELSSDNEQFLLSNRKKEQAKL